MSIWGALWNRIDIKIAKGFGLGDSEVAQSEEFKKGDKGDDDFTFGGMRLKEGVETNVGGEGDTTEKGLDFVWHTPALHFKVTKRDGGLGLFEDALKGREEFDCADVAELFGGLVGVDGKLDFTPLTIGGATKGFAGGEIACGVFVAFVFNELANEVPARVERFDGLVVFGFVAIVFGEQEATFDHHEGGGHDDEFASDVDVKGAEGVEVGHILGGDMANGDIVDINFVFTNEIEQQVQGPFEGFEGDFVVVKQRKCCVHLNTYGRAVRFYN